MLGFLGNTALVALVVFCLVELYEWVFEEEEDE